MNILKDIIQRCHDQHAAPLRQRKTVVIPALYRSHPYHFKVQCARKCPMLLIDLEQADISFMPIGHAPENDRGPRDFGGVRFSKRQGTIDWHISRWYASWGIQIYTGIPSERQGARWHDVEFKYEAICAAPEAVSTCIDALIRTTGNPLLTLTKSGGLRFSCRVPYYLHPNTDETKFYIYKHTPTPDNPYHRDVCLEIQGEKGYSCWDMRCEILIGNLLDPPVIPKDVLFAPIDVLRAVLHEPEPPGKKYSGPEIVIPSSLGSDHLDLAKEALLKRHFVYEREENGTYHWHSHGEGENNTYVSLWEDQGIVWIRASTPNTELPTRAVPITDVWDDTGITFPISTTGLPVSEKVLAIQEGHLSPLAIKRPPPALQTQKHTKKGYATFEEHAVQLRRALNQNTRILALMVSEANILTNTDAETFILNNYATCINVPNRKFAEAIEDRYRARNLSSFVRWRAKKYRWERVEDIPAEERMVNPFQHGNVCEDPERCFAIEQKGVISHESICPQCPVNTECQERGYLSQFHTVQHVKAQITPTFQLFLNPERAQSSQHIFESEDETERICIIDEGKTSIDHLFLECGISKNILEQWRVNWNGSALGNFAKALMNALKTPNEPYGSPIGQIRSVIQVYQQSEEDIIYQMNHINVQGKVVEHGTVDAETGEELARYSIEFQGGASAYIPLDTNAEDRLRAIGIPTFPLPAFMPNEDMRIPMPMSEAIELGILDVETFEKINALPIGNKNPNWTYWHQFKRFFEHYTRDADAPMRWSGTSLRFWIPPLLHPTIKRLLLVSTTLTEQHIRRVFPDEEIDVVHMKPTAWVQGNKVFQLRADRNSPYTILNYGSSWDILGLSKLGERYFFGIRAEINRDPSVTHAIITNSHITKKLTDLTQKENVCFVTSFKELVVDTKFEASQVVWIVGMPRWPQHTVWWRAQMLFGNDETPLNYSGDMKTGKYKDERIQGVYDQSVTGLLTQIVGCAGLNRWTDKTVMLLTSLPLPNITDRAETTLFDWEDFEVAGGLHRLTEAIRTRERFENESTKLTAESSRQEVERVLGCSARQANYILQRLRGGNIPRVSIREQILFLLATGGEKKTSLFTTAIDSSPQTIANEIKRLVDAGEIVRVRRGVYTLPKT